MRIWTKEILSCVMCPALECVDSFKDEYFCNNLERLVELDKNTIDPDCPLPEKPSEKTMSEDQR